MQTYFDLNRSSYWYPLIWILFAGAVLSRMPKRTESVCGRRVQRWHWPVALALVLPVILWAGCRTNFIDTYVYIQNFQNTTPDLAQIPQMIGADDKDWGYYSFVVLLKALGVRSYTTYFLIMATIQVVCMVYTFRKYSDDLWTCIFLFIASTDYYSWMHNGMRQFTAVCLLFAAFELLVEKRYMRFALVTLLASTIHGSAILMLPFAFVMTGPALNRKTMLMIAAVALVIPSADSLMPVLEDLLMDTQYDDVMTNGIWETDDGTNLIRVLVYSVPALVALVGIKYIRRSADPAANLCANAAMITMAMYLVSAVTSGIYIGRIPIYTTLHGYLILPWMIDQIFEKQSARLVKMLMVGLYVMFYYYQMGMTWSYL